LTPRELPRGRMEGALLVGEREIQGRLRLSGARLWRQDKNNAKVVARALADRPF
jgi:hypothetical protein